jgi:hypothetical protein
MTTKHQPTKTNLRKWLLLLMGRMPVTMSADEVETKIQLMVPGLQIAYPAEVFCEASLHYVSADLEFFREHDIRALLDRWQRVNLPDETKGLPPEAASAPLNDEGKQWAAFWFRHAHSDESARGALLLIRSKHLECFSWLLRSNVQAAAIAVRLGWVEPGSTFNKGVREAEWGQPEVVLRAVRCCLGEHLDGEHSNPTPTQVAEAAGMLRAIVGRYAPQNLRLIPETYALTGG